MKSQGNIKKFLFEGKLLYYVEVEETRNQIQ